MILALSDEIYERQTLIPLNNPSTTFALLSLLAIIWTILVEILHSNIKFSAPTVQHKLNDIFQLIDPCWGMDLFWYIFTLIWRSELPENDGRRVGIRQWSLVGPISDSVHFLQNYIFRFYILPQLKMLLNQ
jgi:hypothetical protein